MVCNLLYEPGDSSYNEADAYPCGVRGTPQFRPSDDTEALLSFWGGIPMSDDMMQLLKSIYLHYLKSGDRTFHLEHIMEHNHGDSGEMMKDYMLLHELSRRLLIEPADPTMKIEAYCDTGAIDVLITKKGMDLAKYL